MQPGDQSVNVGGGGVRGERRATGRWDAIPAADRLRAMVADPHGDAFRVEDLADIVRVDGVDGETDRPTPVLRRRRADNRDEV
jgi:hypothetical protein